MSKIEQDVDRLKTLRAMLLGASAFTVAFAGTAFAQDQGTDGDDEEDVTVIEETDAEATQTTGDTVVVTGSRLKKNTFTSIAPLQVISGDVSREIGLIDPADILQSSTAAGGQQIDETFQGFVLDNGPGSSTIDLRGLGASRTLVLINGRRVAPAGVEGAPRSPDLNLMPRSIIDRYEVLLDGASSVYGSDAVAGVTNAILRKDFDGLEIEAFVSKPEQKGGEDYTIRASYGINSDRGFVGFGAEFNKSERVKYGDRKWTGGCDEHYEIDENGNFRNLSISNNVFFSENFGLSSPDTVCKPVVQAGFIQGFPTAATVFYQPGYNGLGVPNFADTFVAGVPVDADGDGAMDFNFDNLSLAEELTAKGDLFSELDRGYVMAYGEYTFEGEMNLTPYFEALYAYRKSDIDSGTSNNRFNVPGGNPFNPCNPSAPGGVDCGAALGAGLFSNPNYVSTFAQANFPTCDFFGFTLAQCTPALFGLGGASGPADLSVVAAIRGDKERTYVDIDQIRFVGGVGGDLPFMNFGAGGWSFDLYGIYTKSEGDSARTGIRDDKKDLALGNFSNTGTPCVDDTGTLDAAITAGCVPIDVFSPNVLGVNGIEIGSFSQAEADYLFDTRDFKTEYTQTVVNGTIQGGLFELPAGTMNALFGFEIRNDEIVSTPDDVAAQGLFRNFFTDLGAEGKKETRELFVETSIPVLANQPLAREMNLELSARLTDDEFYGEESTYSAKLGWRPVDPLLLRATYGTSFRAPNLAENFLKEQTGFVEIFDPCVVPDAARQETAPNSGVFTYNAALDTRTAEQIAACTREGLDPLTLGLQSTAIDSVYTIEIGRGGDFDLLPETSRSFSGGFSFEQPWFESFDLNMSMTYYDIEIEQTIVEPSGGFILFDCYSRQDPSRSTFCDRITRDSSDLIDFIDGGFINRDLETAAGIDYNVSFLKELTVFGEPVDLNIDVRANQLKERSTLFVNDQGERDADTFVGEWGFPEWRGISTVRLDYDDYRLSWSTNYLGEVGQDPDSIDAFDDVDGFSDTCGGPSRGDVLCRDFAEADAYMTHSLSLYYSGDNWTIGGGIRNLLNEGPPKVDSSEITAINNAPLGYGYDLNGRTFFFNIERRFQ